MVDERLFADLVEGGMDPDNAVDATAQALQAEQQQTTLGNTASTNDIANLIGGGTTQAAQMGESAQTMNPMEAAAPMM